MEKRYSLIIFSSYNSQGGFECTSTMFVRYSVIAALCVTLFQGDYLVNHNYNKILKSDWLSTALISALIGQFDRTVRVMPK